jgi:low temperature requirement protein LtrA
MTGLLRHRTFNGESRVGFIELFFDLVYVFAITQLAYYLAAHYDGIGVLQSIILFLAVWWAWVYTSWATNWADVDRAPVRLMLAGLMLISLFMSAAIPNAFAGGGLMFALAYAALQIGRTAFMTIIMHQAGAHNWKNMLRITAYFLVSAPLWIMGALSLDPTTQLTWWAAALLIEYAAPMLLFWFPGLGKSSATDWDISGAHMAERAGLFIIIALGEGIIVMGGAFADLLPTASNIGALATAFIGSFAMWWIYFDVGAKRGSEHIEHHENPGNVARLTYTYLHIPIVAGIVVLAVADKKLLAAPLADSPGVFVATLAGGMALFLTGTAAFKWASSGRPYPPLSHLIGLGLSVALGLWGWLGAPSTLLLGGAGAALMITVALWEWFSLHGGWRRWWLGERPA